MNELLASPHFGEHLAIGWLDAAVTVHEGAPGIVSGCE